MASVYKVVGGWGQEREREQDEEKGPEETFQSGVYVHHLDCGNGFTSIYICESLSNCVL